MSIQTIDDVRAALVKIYMKKYPHNPSGVLSLHIDRLVKDGISEDKEQAILDLAQQLGVEISEPDALRKQLEKVRQERKAERTYENRKKVSNELYEKLFSIYSQRYSINPSGILELRINKEMSKGKSREVAILDIAEKELPEKDVFEIVKPNFLEYREVHQRKEAENISAAVALGLLILLTLGGGIGGCVVGYILWILYWRGSLWFINPPPLYLIAWFFFGAISVFLWVIKRK